MLQDTTQQHRELLRLSTKQSQKIEAEDRLPLIKGLKDKKLLLQKLQLYTKDGKLTRGALMLFGKDPQYFYPSAYARIGRFKSEVQILDTVEVRGNLFQQLDGIMNAIKKHISVRFDISVKDLKLEELARKDIWEYPLEALREAVINALIHRDYLDTAPIRIKIYEDKITIWNLGKLMPPLTVEMLKQEHSGYHRNRFITAVFYYAGLIEKCVSGTIRIIQLCKEQGLPEPEFMETPIGIGAFPITFNKDIYTEEQLRKLELNERQIKAEMYVNGKGKITNKEYREISNLKERFATIVLNNLVNKGILVKYGTTGRGTYYAVAKTQKPHKTRSKDADKDNNVD